MFSKLFLHHMISKAGGLFILFAYHSIDDHKFNAFIVDLGATYNVSLAKQLG